jgi:hypothetical protein
MSHPSFDEFRSAYRETSSVSNRPVATDAPVDADFAATIAALGGKTFDGGLYRVCRGDEIRIATEAMRNMFPEYRKRITAFAYDWLGRHFVIDNARVEGGKPLILLMEPGAGETLEIPAPIVEFHNSILLTHRQDALAAAFYDSWKQLDPPEINHEDCIGYRVPLFLGGDDTVENLERTNMSVYLEISAQLRARTRTLKDGQTIGDIRIR